MSDALLITPHIARLVVFFLLDQAEVSAIVDDRVWTDVPTNAIFPLVRVTQLGGGTGQHRMLSQTVIQVDAWGPGVGDRHAANRLAEACASSLARLRDLVDYGGETAVVTAVNAGQVGDSDDDTFTPARPRSRFTATIWATPVV